MLQDEVTRNRAQSFGQIADDYDRFRPEPPGDALDWLLPADADDVVEIGAGTGLLTRHLVQRVTRVRAVEPDARMRAVLAQRAPGAEIVAGGAEELPADDGSVDAVIGSSMWHWVDEERAVPEVARVLRPGGRLALLWCGPDRNVDWMRDLWAAGQALERTQATVVDGRRRDRRRVELGDTGAFGPPETTTFIWTTPMRPADLIGLAGTYSAVITLDPSGRAAILEAMTRHLRDLEDLGGRDAIDVPMRCLCWRAERQ